MRIFFKACAFSCNVNGLLMDFCAEIDIQKSHILINIIDTGQITIHIDVAISSHKQWLQKESKTKNNE